MEDAMESESYLRELLKDRWDTSSPKKRKGFLGLLQKKTPTGLQPYDRSEIEEMAGTPEFDQLNGTVRELLIEALSRTNK